jgi:hypothetical protein
MESLTAREASQYLGVSTKAVGNAAKKGWLPFVWQVTPWGTKFRVFKLEDLAVYKARQRAKLEVNFA